MTVTVGTLDPSSVDAEVAAHYGDPMREQRALATSAGLVDRSNRGVVAVTGPDRHTWLHSLTTQHLDRLPAMSATTTLFLSPHGHVEHHADVIDDGESTFLVVEPGEAPALLDFLTRMRFLLRVEPVDVTGDWALLSLVGPQTPAALESLGVQGVSPVVTATVPGPKFASGALAAAPTSLSTVVKMPSRGYAHSTTYGADLLVPRDVASEVSAAVGVPLAGLWAFEALRVAELRPRLGFETDHRTLPAEVGWTAAAVHLEKGCYRGQETVARVHNMGKPPRRLVLLQLDGVAAEEPPASHTAVTTVDGREVGFVGTGARHHESGLIASALLKRSLPDDTPLRVGPSAAAIDSLNA
jgi:folate-binding protein YgfZ